MKITKGSTYYKISKSHSFYKSISKVLLTIFCLSFSITGLSQDINISFVRVTKGVPGVYYKPSMKTKNSSIAILIMHSDADYLSFPMCEEMAKRGFSVLCANVKASESALDDKLLNVASAVKYLRDIPSIKKIVLMGHSGGGTLMSAYQNIAENGPTVCQNKHKIITCSSHLNSLPVADGLMLLDSNWGISSMMVFSIDPAVLDEKNGQKLDPNLDLFNPKNGFNPAGSDFSQKFISTYQKAQGIRNNQLIDNALVRLSLIQKGLGQYVDDEPFSIPGAAQGFMNNKLFAQDTKLMSHTQKPWPLIHADGSETIETVHSVRKTANPISYTNSFYEGALNTTVRNFLVNFAVRTTSHYGYDADSVSGIDWSSSYNTPIGNIAGIKSPLLIMGMTGNWEYLASETIYNKAQTHDKTLAFVEGASHLFTTAHDSETYAGQFGDTLKTTCDYVAKWLEKPERF